MGSVYLARHPELRRQVAIKLLPVDADAEDIERFKREARAAARLRHSGIVSVHEVGEDNGRHYFTMDCITGGNLQDLLKKGRMPARRAFELIRDVADALAYAHEQGVVHRDLKPQNIMLDERGEPMISDFGLARVADDVSLSRTGTMVGTPSFMSPEQARGETHAIDARSDIWAVGACLYQMMTGALPFDGTSVLDVLLQISEIDPKPIRALHAALPRDAEAIVFKCLTKEPAGRYQTAAALREDIDRFLHGVPVTARPVTVLRRAFAWVRRNRAISITASLGFLGIATTLTYAFWLGPAMKAASLRRHIAAIEQAAATACVAEDARLVKQIEGDADAVIRDAKGIADRVRAKMAAKDDGEKAAVERGLASYRTGPLLSRAHHHKKEWSFAYRYDPTGNWGLDAQIEVARKLRTDLRLAEAATILGRIRSRFPGTEAAKRAVAEIGDVLAERGDLEGALAAYLESGAQPERAALLHAILGRRQTIPLKGIAYAVPFAPQGCERMPILRLDAPTVVLPCREGRPAFRITRDGLVPTTSPLSALDPADTVADLCDADIDGDGRREVVAAVYRGNRGGGFAIIDRVGDGWKLRCPPDYSNSAEPICIAAGDIDGDKRDEVFVIFMWRSTSQWIVQWRDRPVITPFEPGGARPWVLSAGVADLDGDGKQEAFFGRSGQLEARVEFFEVQDRKFTRTNHYTVGEATTLTVLPDGRLAIAARAFADYPNKELQGEFGVLEEDALVFAVVRRTKDGITQVARHISKAGANVSGNAHVGSVGAGTLAGRPAICYTTVRGAFDPLQKKTEGQRLRVILGEPSSEPHVLGVPWNLRSFHVYDVDGDGESEIIAALEDSLVVLGRREGPAPKLPTVESEAVPANEAALLLRSANDLIESDSFDAARDILAEIADRFPDRPEASDALRLRCDVLLLAAQLVFAVADREMNTRPASSLVLEKRAVERCRQAAVEAREVAARFSDRGEIRRRFLMFAAEASRLALDFAKQRDDLTAALQCARASDDKRVDRQIKTLDGLVSLKSVIEGDAAADALPFVTNAPSRVRRDGTTLEVILDSHSDRIVAGVPVLYARGGVTVELDLELRTSVWSAVAQFGLVPRTGGSGNPMYGALETVLHGTTTWDKQSVRFTLPGSGVTSRPGCYRGKWRMLFSYMPEAGLQTLEVRDADGATIFRGRAEATPMPGGPLLFGVAMEYAGGDALLSHSMHPAWTQLRISNVVLRGSDLSVDTATLTDPANLELAAGGKMVRGDRAGAADLYRQAIERDTRLIRARIYLAMASDDPSPIAEALRIDPYGAACTLDDVVRGAGPESRRALGALVRRVAAEAKGLDRAACLSLQGDFEDAAVELAKLPVTPARQYLLRRGRIGAGDEQMAAWDWLMARQMRTAGSELPPLAWAPEEGVTREEMLEEVNRAAQTFRTGRRTIDALKAWVTASRHLLMDPDNVEVLRFRGQMASAFGMQGPEEHDLLRIVELRPNDSNAALLVARLFGSRRASRETLEFIERAIKVGLRDARLLDLPEFQFLGENDAFKKLRDRLRTE